MLKSALQFMIERCEKEMGTTPRAPYYAHLQSEKAVVAKLNDDMVLTSKSDVSI
jgi:hypothetical protein